MLKLAVLVSGGGTNLQAIMDCINNGKITNAQIQVVISNKEEAFGLERARKAGIPARCISPKSYEKREDFNGALLGEIQSHDIDLVVLAGYLVILPEILVQEYQNRIINIHPSLLPSFGGVGCYGLKVHEKVLERGCKVTGATVHFVDEGTDTGPIILQKSVEVLDNDTPQTLQQRVMEEAEWNILPKSIDFIANGKIVVEKNKVRRI